MYGFKKLDKQTGKIKHLQTFPSDTDRPPHGAYGNDTRGRGHYAGELRVHDHKRHLNVRLVDNDEAEDLIKKLWAIDDEFERLKLKIREEKIGHYFYATMFYLIAAIIVLHWLGWL